MGKYIGKRLLLMIPVVIGVAITIFTIMYFVPGDPAQIILGTSATEADLAAKRTELGLDQPYLVRLGTYLSDIFLHGNFGKSYINNTPITQELLGRLPRTLLLGVISIAIALLVGVPLGISAAVHQGSWMDNICMFIALVGVSMPTFWVALMLVILFALKLGWLPAMGIGGIQYYILPCIANSFGGIATQARQARSSMLEVMRQDYIRTARAKGLSERKVIYHHAFRNTLIPLVTIIGGSLPGLFSGALITETLYSIPGIGYISYQSMVGGDIPFSMFYLVFMAVLTLLGNLISDILYAVVDPRVRIA